MEALLFMLDGLALLGLCMAVVKAEKGPGRQDLGIFSHQEHREPPPGPRKG